MGLLLLHLIDIHWMYISLSSASDFWVEVDFSINLKTRKPLICSSMSKRALVPASTALRNMSLIENYSYGWRSASASVRVPLASS